MSSYTSTSLDHAYLLWVSRYEVPSIAKYVWGDLVCSSQNAVSMVLAEIVSVVGRGKWVLVGASSEPERSVFEGGRNARFRESPHHERSLNCLRAIFDTDEERLYEHSNCVNIDSLPPCNRSPTPNRANERPVFLNPVSEPDLSPPIRLSALFLLSR